MLPSKMLSPWLVEGVIPNVVTTVGRPSSFFILQGDLTPPFRAPAVVDELRFTGVGSGSGGSLLDVFVTISVGRQVICADVPIDVLTKPLDLAVLTGATGVGVGAAYSRTIKFSKPLFVPSDGSISVKVRLADPMSRRGTPFNVTVAAVGRSLPEDFKAPPYINVPYASSWYVTGVTGSFQSTPSDLRNGTLQTLNVGRFTTLAISAGQVFAGLDNPAMAFNATLQLFGQNGLLGVRDPTPLGVLAFFGRMSWTARSKLPPSGFYTADLTYNLTPPDAGPFAFAIAMVGYRQVPSAELGVDL